MTETEKRKKRAEEIALELKQEERGYDKLLADAIQSLKINVQDYDEKIIILTTKRDGTVHKTIEKLGSRLASGLLKDAPEKISAKLKRDLKSVISRSTIHEYLEEHHPDWINQSARFHGNPTGKNQYSTTSSRAGSSSTLEEFEPLTKQESEAKKAYDDELIRNELYRELVHKLTSKTNTDFIEIRKKTQPGKNWAHTLLKESESYMKTIAHQMTDSALQDTLDDLRVVKIIADGFSDIVYEVTKQREKQPRE